MTIRDFLVRDYKWIHLGIGAAGNLLFFIGSIFFLPSFHGWMVAGVWLFIIGSALMLIGAVGSFLVEWKEPQDRPTRGDRGSKG